MYFMLMLILKLRGIVEVDKFLDDKSKLVELTDAAYLSFMHEYLKHDFDREYNNKFRVFEYLNYGTDPVIIGDLGNSNYFNSIPGDEVINALIKYDKVREYYVCDYNDGELIKMLISKITPDIIENIPVNDIARVLCCYNGMGLENILCNLKLNDLNLRLVREIEEYSDAEAYFRMMVNFLPNYVLKEFLANSNLTMTNMVMLLKNNFFKTQMLDILYVVANMNKNREVPIILDNGDDKVDFDYISKKVKEQSENSYFKEMLRVINHDEFFISEDKEYIANKIIATDDVNNAIAYLNIISGDDAKIIIDWLLDKGYLVSEIIKAADISVLDYIIDEYIKKNKKVDDSNWWDAFFITEYELEKINFVLEYLLLIKKLPCSLSYDMIVELLSLGVNLFYELLSKTNLYVGEGILILENLREIERYDLCTMYGAYLLTGDKTKLMTEEEVAKRKNYVLTLKKN